jgi:rare lipoprotein A
MSVRAILRLSPLVIGVLLAACGTSHQSMQPLPGKPDSHAARHPKIDPGMPALPKAGSGRGGYYQDDGPGDDIPPNLMEVPDAVVKAEPYVKSRANQPYTVLGKTYTPLINDEPFQQRGIGSWYGRKFHGQRTSSGEPYDMYKMTAAHPTLPIPSYVRITSVESGKQVVVRVNDRGPFHSSRVIDMSFTAALKLGLLGKGSHEVIVERLLPDQPETLAQARRNAPPAENAPALGGFPIDLPREGSLSATESTAPAAPVMTPVAGTFYLQLGAFSRPEKAAELRAALMRSGALIGAIEVVEGGPLHRVFSGPFENRVLAAQAAGEVPAALNIRPIVVRR